MCRAVLIPSNLPWELVLYELPLAKKKKSFCGERNRKMLLFFWFWYFKNTIGCKIKVNNTKFVAILIRFSGTSVLPFCLCWANTACALWRMFNTGKAKAQQSPTISCERRKVCCVRLYSYPCMLNMCHSALVVLAQRKNGSAPVSKNRMSITTNLVLLTYVR